MKIFDSLIHPYDDNGEFHKPKLFDGNDVSIFKYCAVGMPGVKDFSLSRFYEECKEDKRAYPVAPLLSANDIESQLERMSKIGFNAVKIHPRCIGRNFNVDAFKEVLRENEKYRLKIFLCTYNYPSFCLDNGVISYDDILESLREYPSNKIVLLHGGGVELLKFAELVRANNNLLLDLSFTMLKYSGSSIDLDIKFLFENFDRRICVGSDFPDFTPNQLCEKLKLFSANLSKDKKENIAYRNLLEFLELNE